MNQEPIARLARLLEADLDGHRWADTLIEVLGNRVLRNALAAYLTEITQNDVDEGGGGGVLSGMEQVVVQIVGDLGPVSAEDVSAVGEGYGSRSLRHKQHASTALNRLVARGRLGKIIRGRGPVKFAQAHDAVRAVLTNQLGGRLPEECTAQDLTAIADYTELPVSVVSRVIADWDSQNV